MKTKTRVLGKQGAHHAHGRMAVSKKRRTSSLARWVRKFPVEPKIRVVEEKKLNGSVPIGDKNQDKFYEIFAVLIRLYSLYGFRDKNYDVRRTFEFWSRFDADWMDIAKYKLSSFVAYWSDTAPVPPPLWADGDDCSVLLGGKAARWVKLTYRTDVKRFDSFLMSVQMSKFGMPRPEPERVAQEVKKTVEMLTTARADKPGRMAGGLRFPGEWGDEDQIENDDDYVGRHSAEQQLRRTVREIFFGKKFTIDDRIRPFFPSTNANYNFSRVGGGAVGALSAFGYFDGMDMELEYKYVGKHGRGYAWTDRFAPLGRDELGRVTYTGVWENEDEAIEDESEQPEYEVDDTNLRASWAKIYWRLLRDSDEEVAEVKAVGLGEPLKVRTISAGPVRTYTALKPLQKFMWKSLKSFSTFLVSQPVSADVISAKLGRLSAGQKFLSGDYSAATNKIMGWVSEVIANEIADVLNLSTLERRVFLKALTGHVFNNGVEGERLPFEVIGTPQMSGQLMGSVVSFPILCIANATVCRWAMEIGERRAFSLHDIPLLINGDDCVFRTTPAGHTAWLRISDFFGLEPSPGKYFWSDQFCEMNSRKYKYCPAQDKIYSEVPFINFGLLFGLKRSIGVGTKPMESFSSAGARARELFSTLPEYLSRKEVMRLFLEYNKSSLPSRVPYFIPEYLGGLGLPWVESKLQPALPDDVDDLKPEHLERWYDYGPSKVDRRIANMILLNWDQFHIRRPADPTPWKISEYVQTRMPPVQSGVWSDEDYSSYGRLYGLLAVEALSKRGLKSLFDPKPDSTAWSAVKHNAEYWNPSKYKRMRFHGHITPPASDEAILTPPPDKLVRVRFIQPVKALLPGFHLPIEPVEW